MANYLIPNLRGFSIDTEFIDNSGYNWAPHLNLRLLGGLVQLKDMHGYCMVISRVTGAIGREDKSTSDHNILANSFKEVRALDVRVTHKNGQNLSVVEAREFYDSAIYAGFNSIGVYPYWNPNPGFHLGLDLSNHVNKLETWADIGVRDSEGNFEHKYVAVEYGFNNWPKG